ncbi:MAG: AraC family transcriptional regulator [Pseudomonadales bacterium]
MQIPTVPIHYVNSLLTRAEQRGLDRQRLIIRSGLAEELFSEQKTRVSAEVYVNLSKYLMRELQDESCGLMSRRIKPGTFAMMCHASINSSSLARMLQRCTQFYALVNDDLEFSVSQKSKSTKYSIQAVGGSLDSEEHILMILLALMHRLAGWAVGQPLVLEQVRLTREMPTYANDYNLLFESPVVFGAKLNCLQFSSNYMEMPVVQDQQSLDQLLRDAPMSFMTNLSGDGGLVSRISEMLRQSLPGAAPSIDEVAHTLGTSTATLRRHLSASGCSYKQLKDNVRRDRAIFLLGRNKTVDEVAVSTGFAETTSFFRAFKRWTGSTPKAYVPVSH